MSRNFAQDYLFAIPPIVKSWFGIRKAKKDVLESKEAEIAILIMGTTGAGRSTFINTAIGRDAMLVGHGLESCTSDIQVAKVDTEPLTRDFNWLQNRSLILVDTPGFDHTDKKDAEILEMVAKWLKESCKTRILAGVIYLHDISLDRYNESAKRNLEMFRQLCGDDALNIVTIGATKSSRVDAGLANRRFDKLSTKHWNLMIKKGAKAAQVDSESDTSTPSQVIRDVLKRFGARL